MENGPVEIMSFPIHKMVDVSSSLFAEGLISGGLLKLRNGVPWRTGWWFQTFGLFSPIVGMMIQSDELHHFSGWLNHQPEDFPRKTCMAHGPFLIACLITRG